MRVTESALAKESTFERFRLIAGVSDLPGSGFCGDGSQDLGPLPRPQTARGAREPPEMASKGSGPLLPPHFSFQTSSPPQVALGIFPCTGNPKSFCSHCAAVLRAKHFLLDVTKGPTQLTCLVISLACGFCI